ncbi:MAG: MraY family glycosyltransferase [Bacteroidetes bacterium]|nr:MraY family glycosyltransferase [Bacteroidota bacterium]
MFTSEYNILFAFLTSLILTYVVVPKIIFLADKFRLSDVPGERSSHKRTVPVFGSIAIFSGIIFSLIFWAEIDNIQFILVSLVIVFFVGVIDDLLGLSPYKKIIGQLIAILILIYLGKIQINSMHGVLGVYELPDIIATLFTVFVVIVITNGFNLIDGVDGLASGIGVIASLGFGVMAYLMNQTDMAIIAFSLLGALLAFLKYNFHPARLFMGDTGSLLVGMTLSVLAINLIHSGVVTETIHFPNKGPLIAVVFLAIPLFDSLRVFVVRIIDGKNPLYAGREHIHHALLDLGLGHKRTAFALYLMSLLLIAVAYFLLELNINSSIAILALVSFIILMIPYYILRKRK